MCLCFGIRSNDIANATNSKASEQTILVNIIDANEVWNVGYSILSNHGNFISKTIILTILTWILFNLKCFMNQWIRQKKTVKIALKIATFEKMTEDFK